MRDIYDGTRGVRHIEFHKWEASQFSLSPLRFNNREKVKAPIFDMTENYLVVPKHTISFSPNVDRTV